MDSDSDPKNPKLERLLLIHGYQKWIQDHVNKKWQPYQISFMFHSLPGKTMWSLTRQMKSEIERVYARLVTRFVRNPRSRAQFERLPRMILFPDFPVYKREGRRSIEDVSINNGLHYGGIALTPPFSRFTVTLDVYFDQDQDKYVNKKLERIHVTPITWNPAYVTDYVAKSFKRGRVSDEDIVILPKSISELPSK
jgi:hypothetical protein